MIEATILRPRLCVECGLGEFRHDHRFAEAVLARAPRALEHFDYLCCDRDLVLQVVHTDGFALKFAGRVLRDDRGVVMVAVTNTWRALQFASEACRADGEIVRVAMKQSSCARRWVVKPII